MFNFLDEIVQQYLCIVGTFGKIWNAFNECGDSKTFKRLCNQYILLFKAFKNSIEVIWKWHFYRKFLCTPLFYSII